MTIVEFFDQYDIRHIKAYDHLCKTGSWPQSFIELLKENEIEFTTIWQTALAFKMAQSWVAMCLEEND